jgi:arylsulfatase
LPATYYGYETIDGFRESGESDASDPRRRLSELVDELEVRQVERNNEVPAEVRNRLEQLGYA